MRYFTTLNGRITIIDRIIRACDVCSTDSMQILGFLCIDNATGNSWYLWIDYFNPINTKRDWTILLKQDKAMRENDFIQLL